MRRRILDAGILPVDAHSSRWFKLPCIMHESLDNKQELKRKKKQKKTERMREWEEMEESYKLAEINTVSFPDRQSKRTSFNVFPEEPRSERIPRKTEYILHSSTSLFLLPPFSHSSSLSHSPSSPLISHTALLPVRSKCVDVPIVPDCNLLTLLRIPVGGINLITQSSDLPSKSWEEWAWGRGMESD